MNTVLISSDGDLCKLCREICNEYHDLVHLTQVSPGNCPPGADLYIWDSPTRTELSPGMDLQASKHLFLVHRKDVAEFHENLGSVEAVILLKPVTRGCLSAFLGFVVAAFQNRTSTPGSLRADRDEMLQCLIQSNLQIQEYDQDRTNFLARALHDFRAPLTASNGYCGLLLSEALGPVTEDQKEVLQRMQNSIKRLSRMTSSMFDLSIGRHVKRQPDLRKADIRECVEQALHEITPLAEGKNISLSVDLDSAPGALYLEPGQIEQVLLNLLDNACKFTPKRGLIDVHGYPFFWERRVMRLGHPSLRERRHVNSRSANSYRIDIRDSGPRISPEHLENIFEEYTSYAGGQDRSGGGLGLAICRMIITAHDGRVWLENTEHGPRFSFVLPLRGADSGEAETVEPLIAGYGRVERGNSIAEERA